MPRQLPRPQPSMRRAEEASAAGSWSLLQAHVSQIRRAGSIELHIAYLTAKSPHARKIEQRNDRVLIEVVTLGLISRGRVLRSDRLIEADGAQHGLQRGLRNCSLQRQHSQHQVRLSNGLRVGARSSYFDGEARVVKIQWEPFRSELHWTRTT